VKTELTRRKTGNVFALSNFSDKSQ
jgi:hypothetical protein